MFPGVSDTLFRQPGYQALDLTRGFASPPRDGFALSDGVVPQIFCTRLVSLN